MDAEKLQELTRGGLVGQALKVGSRDHDAVTALQALLNNLGFGNELKWEDYGADGHYSPNTALAVRTFARRNGLNSDGSQVTAQIAEKILACSSILDDLRTLATLVNKGSQTLPATNDTHDLAAFAACQNLLSEIGFDLPLGQKNPCSKGHCGKAILRPLEAFAKSQGIDSNGDALTPELAEILLAQFTHRFGDRWKEVPASPKARATEKTLLPPQPESGVGAQKTDSPESII